jgi:hypothetical protein
MKRGALLLFAVSLLLVCTIAAQEPNEPSRGPDGGTRFHVAGIEVLPVAGRPFTGRDTIEWTRNLEDGSVLTTHLSAKVARDSQGRIYREHVTFVPVNTDQQSRVVDMVLLDPTTHTRTTCTVATHRCAVTSYYAPVVFTPAPVGSHANGTRYLTREVLGTNVVDGLNVEGTRETLSINAGAIGNTKPLVTTREMWYSPELQINLSVTRKDPTEGTQVIQLVDLVRSEPDPAMFQVPADFVVPDVEGSAKAGN